MKLIDIVNREPVPEPWSEGEKIPWNEPDFSRRMLQLHLSQNHDMASRRFKIIDKHVEFIDSLVGKPTKVLDLGCGPGFYTSRLTALGYECKGIDFSPYSIKFAKERAVEAGQKIEYTVEDIREADYGSGYGLVMIVYGEFNVFRTEDISNIIEKAFKALKPGGLFIAEPHRFEAIKSLGNSPSSWYSADQLLFSDNPHIVLSERFWNEGRKVAVNRYIVIDAASGEATMHADAMQAYREEQYEKMLLDAGFSEVDIYPDLAGEDEENEHLIVIVGRK
jgi:SAM-dependent methyltransferase